MDKNTAQVLREAKALIPTSDKWGKGYREKRPGTYCASEAIGAVTTSIHEENQAKRVFRGVIGMHDITKWNDHPERTFEEVHEAFDKAIAEEAA